MPNPEGASLGINFTLFTKSRCSIWRYSLHANLMPFLEVLRKPSDVDSSVPPVPRPRAVQDLNRKFVTLKP